MFRWLTSFYYDHIRRRLFPPEETFARGEDLHRTKIDRNGQVVMDADAPLSARAEAATCLGLLAYSGKNHPVHTVTRNMAWTAKVQPKINCQLTLTPILAFLTSATMSKHKLFKIQYKLLYQKLFHVYIMLFKTAEGDILLQAIQWTTNKLHPQAVMTGHWSRQSSSQLWCSCSTFESWQTTRPSPSCRGWAACATAMGKTNRQHMTQDSTTYYR